MNTSELATLIGQHKWVPIASVVLGVLVRLAKSDTRIPIDIPPRLRVWLAFGLGQVAAVLDVVVAGQPWKQAIFGGLIASVLAIVGHNTIVDSMRGGKEFPVPGLTLPGVPPSPGKPPSIPAPPLPREPEVFTDAKEDSSPTPITVVEVPRRTADGHPLPHLAPRKDDT